MSNKRRVKRLLEDVFSENKAARPWVEQPFDEEDYAYEAETQSVAEYVFGTFLGQGAPTGLRPDATEDVVWFNKLPSEESNTAVARSFKGD